MARNPNHPIHFCEIPSTAVCEANLRENDFDLFYTNTTNTFSSVTCTGCRAYIKEKMLDPGGFLIPAEWVVEVEPK